MGGYEDHLSGANQPLLCPLLSGVSSSRARFQGGGSASPAGRAQSSARGVPPPNGALSLAVMALMW